MKYLTDSRWGNYYSVLMPNGRWRINVHEDEVEALLS